MHQDLMSLVPTFKNTLSAYGKDPGELENFIILVSSYMHSDTNSNLYMHCNTKSSPQQQMLLGKKTPPLLNMPWLGICSWIPTLIHITRQLPSHISRVQEVFLMLIQHLCCIPLSGW